MNGPWIQLYWVLLFPSVSAHTFLSLNLQQLLLFAATILFICCNYFLFTVTSFYLQQLYLICSMSPVGHRTPYLNECCIPRVAKVKKNCLHSHRARIAEWGWTLIVKLAAVNDRIDTHFQIDAPLYTNKINLKTTPMRITTKYYDYEKGSKIIHLRKVGRLFLGCGLKNDETLAISSVYQNKWCPANTPLLALVSLLSLNSCSLTSVVWGKPKVGCERLWLWRPT